jgi:hypothetical protein
MRTLFVLPLALLVAACSSVSQPPTPGRPLLEVRQSSAIFFGSSATAPLNLDMVISNPAKEAIVVRRVRVQPAPGMMQYDIYPASRAVRETVEPGETKVIHIAATAYTGIARLDATEPLRIRAYLDYDLGGKRHQELYAVLDVGR